MPTNHKNPKPLQRDHTPARTQRERYGLHRGHFRCDRCRRMMPEALMIEQDGLNLCPQDADKMPKSELDRLVAEQTSQVDDFEPCAEPALNAANGAVVVQSVTWSTATPSTSGTGLPIPVYGANDTTVTITGINFASTTSIAIAHNSNSGDDAALTVASVITSTTITLTITQAVTMTSTDPYFTLTIDGTPWSRSVQVRQFDTI